jgi:hypothetical protein
MKRADQAVIGVREMEQSGPIAGQANRRANPGGAMLVCHARTRLNVSPWLSCLQSHPYGSLFMRPSPCCSLAALFVISLALPSLLQADEPPATLLNLPLVFRDDFESGDPATRWEASEPKAWKLVEQNGNKVWSQFQHIETKTPVRSPFNRSVAEDLVVGSCVLDLKLQSTARDYPHRSLCLFFGYQDPAHMYYVHLGQKTDDHANHIFIVNNEPRKKISTKTTEGTKWEPVMTAVDRTFTWGQVGIGSFDDTGNFDDVLVYGTKASRPADVK